MHSFNALVPNVVFHPPDFSGFRESISSGLTSSPGLTMPGLGGGRDAWSRSIFPASQRVAHWFIGLESVLNQFCNLPSNFLLDWNHVFLQVRVQFKTFLAQCYEGPGGAQNQCFLLRHLRQQIFFCERETFLPYWTGQCLSNCLFLPFALFICYRLNGSKHR